MSGKVIGWIVFILGIVGLLVGLILVNVATIIISFLLGCVGFFDDHKDYLDFCGNSMFFSCFGKKRTKRSRLKRRWDVAP